MREPAFWWGKPGIAARLLAPFAFLYGAAAQARLERSGRRAPAPVVCIGNLTVGGAGKTPTALAAARLLMERGECPVFLSRGYGGSAAGPLLVDIARHSAAEVGDEPILLAQVAPTVVARARVPGAKMAIDAGATVIVMDDGFQNPSLDKDFSVLVVDAHRGIGNGYVIPAGPLRAPVQAQLARAHALVVIGDGKPGAELIAAWQPLDIPVFRADLQPDAGIIAALGQGRVLAFAGIADPQKFFRTLTEAGIAVAAARSFPDHHRLRRSEAQALIDEADRDGLVLITTEKDLARLTGDAETGELAARAQALPITLRWREEETFSSLLMARLTTARGKLQTRSPD
jgi:tetraacyldisaccharide 4'-kinase